MKKIIQLVLSLIIFTNASAQFINVSGINKTGRFTSCPQQNPAMNVTAELLNLNAGAYVNNGIFTCNNICDSSTIRVTITNIRWNQSPNAEWLHGIFLPSNLGFVVSAVSIPNGFITYNPGCIGMCPSGSGTNGGPGFYFDNTAANTCCGVIGANDGLPCNNYGDISLTCNNAFNLIFDIKFCNSLITNNSYTFILHGSSDGETGCWNFNDNGAHNIEFTIATNPCSAPAINPTASAPVRVCVGGNVNYTATLTGTCNNNGISWWDDPIAGNLVGTGSPFVYDPAGAACPGGTTLYATCCTGNIAGCISRVPITIPGTCNMLSITNVAVVNATCFVPGSITATTVVNAVGAVNYTLNPGGFNNATGVFTGLTQSVYTMTVTDATGCTATSVVNVTQPAPIVFANPQITGTTCAAPNSGQIIVSATGGGGGITYTINPNATQAPPGTFIGLSPQSYTITATDVNGCTATTLVVVPNSPAVNWVSVNKTNISCSGLANGTITALANGGVGTITYTLTPGGANNNTGIFTGLGPNTYTITAVDVNGCSVTSTVNITSPTVLSWSNVNHINVLCANGNTGSIAALVTGGTPNYQYNLMPGNVNNATGNFSNLVIGTYTITSIDANGCSITTTVTITQPPVINYTFTTATATTCNGGNNGSINVTAAGGTGVLNYTLNPGNITNATGIFPNLTAGNYTITTSDANGCTLTTVITVNQPVPITFPTVNIVSPACIGQANGSIAVSAAGGVGLINYVLNPLGINNNTGNFSGLAAGTYTVVATDVNGCSSSTVIVIAPPTAITFPIINITPVQCNGTNTGAINITASGGAGGFSYLLQPGGVLNNTGIFNGLNAGTYTINAIDANNCSNTTSITVTQPSPIVWNNVTSVNITCNGLTNGSINANASGGVGIISYTLNPGGITNGTGVFNNLAGNIYTLTASDANGCTLVTIINIVNPGVLNIDAVNIAPPNCVPGNNGIIDVVVSGGTSPYLYNIGAGNQPGGNFPNIGQGIYTVTVTDVNGCTATSVVNVVTPGSPQFTNVNMANVSCGGGATGVINVTAAGGVGTINYTLQPGNIVNQTGLFQFLNAGTYTVSATDANNCFTQTIIVITAPIPIIIDSVVHQDILCNNANLGSINVYASGGVPPLTYTLNPGNITNATGAFPNLPLGTYVVTVGDANGCSIQVTVTIILQPIMQWDTVSYSSTYCAGGNNGYIFANVIGGSPPITYNLQPGNITNLTGYFTNLAAGAYQVTATDINGCTTFISINLAQPSPVVIDSIVNTLVSCVPGADGTITIYANGGALPYTYKKGIQTQASNVFTNVTPGIYLITVTDVNGCTVTAWDTVNAPVPPVIVNAVSTQTTCDGDTDGSITATAAGGLGAYTFNLMPGNITNNTGQFNNLAGGTYTVTVTDILNCTGSSIISVYNPPPVTVSGVTITQPSCIGNTNGSFIIAAVGGTGGYTYTLNPGGFTNINGVFNNLGAGIYTISVSDANGCTTSSTITMTQPTQVTWSNVTFVQPTCNGLINGTITVLATGGTGIIDYLLLPNGTVNNTGTFNNINAGTYTIIAADANGCSISSIITVTQPNILTISNIAVAPPSCIPGNDGTLTITATGGTTPYTYSIGAGNQASNVFGGLAGGTYTVTVSDMNGCTTSNVVSMANPGAPVVNNVTPVNATCNGSNDGSITVVTAGGAPVITYTLQPLGISNNTGIFNNLGPNTYTINVTDANGCTTVATATITAPNSMIFTSLINTAISCFGGNNATVTAIVTGGTGTITYNLQPANINNVTGVFNNLAAGVYTITATDINGCSTSSTTTIITPPQLVWANVVSGNVTCNNGINGNISASAIGGTGGINYLLLPNNVTSPSGSFSNLTAGSYTVQATDANGCSITSLVTISQPSAIVISTIGTTTPTCVPGNDATVTITASGGNLPYNYNIGFGNQLSNIFNNVGVGNYTVTITDASGCTVTSAFTVNNPSSPVINSISVTNVTCFGGNNGSLTVNASGGVGQLSYTLLPATTNLTGIFNNLVSNVYTIVVTDINNCTSSAYATINQPNALVISNFVSNNTLCFGQNNGNAQIGTTGGTGIVNYTLLPNNITNQSGTFNNLAVGPYTINCVDANGCSISTTFNITSPPALVLGAAVVGNVLCFNGNDGNINITASGGTNPITYTLQPLGITNNTGFFNSLATGNYTVIATDANGCSVSTAITITQPPPTQLVNYTTISPSCIPGNDGSITINVTGGVPPYQYSINGGNPQLSNTFNNLAAGTYTVLVADMNDCKVLLVVTLASPQSPVFTNVISNLTNCFGSSDGSIQVTATGGVGAISYTLLPNNITNATGIFSNLAAGTYTVNATDANACSVSTIVTVSSPTQITFTNVSQTNTSCFGGNNATITAIATGGTGILNYTLQPINITNATGLFNALIAGVYTLTVTDANGCTISTTVTITQPTQLTWMNVTNTNVNCNGGNNGSITVSATGGTGTINYTLQPNNITNATGIFNGLTAAVYTVVATDANGCTLTTSVTVTQPAVLQITNVTNVTPSCVPGNDGSITITAIGGTPNYSYNIGGANQPGNVFNNIGIGVYTITVIDANGCTVTGTYNVTAPNAPTIVNLASNNVSCNGGNNGLITITATGGAGGINYTLLPNNITNATGNFNNLIAGTYTVNCVDASNCSVTTVIQITQPTPLIWANLQVTNISCFGGSDGIINALVTGGTGAINYNLQPGNQNNATGIFNNLGLGIYTLTGTDANGCTISTTVTITQPTQLTWLSVTNTNVSCNGGSNASITATATGGTGTINYTLQPNNITNATGVFNGLTAGAYTVIAVDANGCTITTSITITQPLVLQITNITNVTPSCVPGNDGSITITVTGGTPNYSYNIGGANQAGNVFNNVGVGVYTITVIDANGCTVTSIYNVVAPNAPTIVNLASNNVSCNGGNNGLITITATGGAGGINYTLLPNNITNATGNFNNLIAGTYTVNCVDASNCSVTTVIQITQPTPLIWANLQVTNISCFGGSDGIINALITGGTGAIIYNLQPGNQNNATGLFNNLGLGIYTLTGTDANGCTISTTVTITQPTQLTWLNVTNTNVSCNGGNDATITVGATGGTGTIGYTLLPNNIINQTGVFNTLTIGVYTIVATDANGCSTTTSITITQPTLLQITNVTNTTPSCVPGNDGTITITASGGVAPYNYNIGGANQFNNLFTNVGAGNYTITITDANGCTVTSIYNVAAPNAPTIASIQTTLASCIPGCDASATITATGGLPAYTYSLDGINFQASNIFLNLCAASYTVTVKDANGCIVTSVFMINTSSAPVITNVASVNILCNGGNNGSIAIQTTGGTGTVTYTLQPNNINNVTGIFPNLTAGIYTVQIVDANGCGTNTVINITQPPLLQFVNIVANGALCNGAQNGTIDVTTTGGTGAITYTINPAANFVPPATFNNLLGNVTYTITATDVNGCSIVTTVFVFQPPALVIDSSFYQNITCFNANNGSINVYVSGGTGVLNYTLNPGAVNNLTGAFTGLAPNIYTVTVTDANNCTLTTTFNIVQPTPIVLVSISATNVSCNNAQDATITVQCSGGTGVINYNLQPGNINNITGLFTALGGGTYTITATDANNCTYTTTISVVNPPLLSYASFVVTNISCFGNNDGIINATATGGVMPYTYTLMPGNIVNATGLYTGLTPGTYTVSVSDANLCSTASTTNIIEPQPLVMVLDSVENVLCNGAQTGAIYLTASGGTLPYTFILNPTGVTNNNGNFQNVGAGIYSVTVVDANGCSTSVANIQIFQPPALVFTTVSHVDVICFGDSTGSITVQAAGGTGNILYSISPALGSQFPLGFFQHLPSLVYTVIATDGNGCTITSLVDVKQNAEIVITELTYQEPRCYGEANGIINFKAVGGVAPLTYHLDNNPGQPTGYFDSVIGGYHLLTITDFMGCRKDSLFLLPQPEPVHPGSLTIEAESCKGSEDGKIIIVGAGGRGGYTYYVRPGLHINKSGEFYGMSEGTYTITIKDTSLCEWDSIIHLVQSDPLNVFITKKDLGCFGKGTEAWAQANVSGGFAPYTYQWSTTPVQVDDRATDLFFGYYFLEVTDAKGCKIQDTVYIEPGPCCDEVFIPNAFSPNGDGNNDLFRVTTSSGIELIQFEVYDRWGQRVWSSSDFRRGWDGTIDGKDASMNTYYYIFRYRCLTDGQTYIKKGDINLVR